MNKWLCSVSFIVFFIIIDMSVLMENRPIKKLVQKSLHPAGPKWCIFLVFTIDDALSCFFTVVWANSQFVYILKVKIQDMNNFHFVVLKTILQHSFLKYCFYHLKIKFIFSCCRVISYLSHQHALNMRW